MKASTVLNQLKNKLIVSCQAEGDSPFNSPEGVAMFALTAQMGGAGGIRSEGIEKTKKIKSIVNLPVIGMIKNAYPDGLVRITRTFEELESLIGIGVDLIAIDGTFRNVGGINGPDFIGMCKEKHPEICIIADIAQTNEALACIENGADAISSTLRGYTPETAHEPSHVPNFQLIQDLCNRIKGVPVIAEGKINTPEYASKIMGMGVWSIVVGSAITRPHIITKWYNESMNNALNN